MALNKGRMNETRIVGTTEHFSVDKQGKLHWSETLHRERGTPNSLTEIYGGSSIAGPMKPRGSRPSNRRFYDE